MNTWKMISLIAILWMFASCGTDDIGTQSTPNILLIIADDVGLDACPGYDIGTSKPNAPNLQSMISSGITFNNLWSAPTCTPTRATILTGKYGFRTEVQKVGDVISTSNTSIQQYLALSSTTAYNTALIGKWHLSNNASDPGLMGINYYAGILSGGVNSYTNWQLVENGQTTLTTDYITTKLTDLAIDWIGDQTQPWFLWMAYNAAHTPFHLPPNDLHSQGSLSDDTASINANPLPYYLAAIEAMDSEIGRLLNSMSQAERDNTVIIFIGDNGSPGQVAQEYNTRRTKGTIYQGGINVPMIVSGNGVSRINETEDALINTTDLFATIVELTGATLPEINDSKSFKSLLSDANGSKRSYVFAEIEDDAGTSDVAIRNATHKYISFGDGSESLFDLSNNEFEKPDLLSANQLPLSTADSIVKEELVTKLAEIMQ